MNKEEKKRIRQNLTYLKERLTDLDGIIDVLIEKDVFAFEDREKIEQVTPSTSQKKFNKFVQLLLHAPSGDAYAVFLDALRQERHVFIVEKLQNTVLGVSSPTKNVILKDNRRLSSNCSSSPQRMKPIRNVETSHRKITSMGQTDVADQFSEFSSFSECLEIRIGDLLQKVRSEEKLEIENLIDKKLDNLMKVCDYEKVQTAICKLEKKIEDLMHSNENYRIAEKYKKLKESVKENEEKWEKLTAANIENQKLKTAHEKITKKMEDLNERINELESENKDLKEELKMKNESVSDLKSELDGSRGRLEELVSKNNTEYRALKKTIERHIEILNASLSAAKISLVPDQWQRNSSQI